MMSQRPVLALRATELECEATILSAAKIGGWRRHGERPAQSRKKWSTPIKGEPGWPDLVLVRGGWMLAVELKRKPNVVEPAQREWLTRLALVPGVLAFVVWVPEGMDLFNQVLVARDPAAWALPGQVVEVVGGTGFIKFTNQGDTNDRPVPHEGNQRPR